MSAARERQLSAPNRRRADRPGNRESPDNGAGRVIRKYAASTTMPFSRDNPIFGNSNIRGREGIVATIAQHREAWTYIRVRAIRRGGA